MASSGAAQVSFLVRLRFTPEDRDEVSGYLRELAAASRLEPGCVSYVTHWSQTDADTVVIYEQYRDRAALEAHRATSHFQRYAIGGLYQRMRERSVEDLDAVY